jgi:nanoRNase/pAp phosphatase (c-di-AMP/oligoRNAs hydrolase)
LAWEYFQQTEVPEFLQYVEDKDLWRFRLPYSKEFSAALRCYEMKFDVWNKLINHVPQLLEEGKVLLRYQNQMVAKLCKNAYLMDIGGYQVPAVNSAVLQSEIGNHLCLTKPEFPFAVVYFEVEQKRYFSLRSVGDFDVAKVAASFGGGGHKNASGFVVG